MAVINPVKIPRLQSQKKLLSRTRKRPNQPQPNQPPLKKQPQPRNPLTPKPTVVLKREQERKKKFNGKVLYIKLFTSQFLDLLNRKQTPGKLKLFYIFDKRLDWIG